jgi:glutamate--cysteine ligase
MKTVYRRGLGLRYGRVMQAISGVHFNYSFPEHFWPVLPTS